MRAFRRSFGQVPRSRAGACAAALSLLALTGAGVAAAPHPPKPNTPILSLPLEPLGYQPAAARMQAGPLYTIHFVDSTHLLVTFNTRGLMPRLPDAAPGDDDRLVAALLLELPSGRVLARTTWRARDREQFLWSLGSGRFLLRIRNRLAVIAPLTNLNLENPFHELPFLEMKRRIAYVTVSPGGDLVTVETAPPRRTEPTGPASTLAQTPAQTPAQTATQTATQTTTQTPAQAPAASGTAPAASAQPPATPQLKTRTAPAAAAATGETEVLSRPPIELHFYRLLEEEPGHLIARAAGILASRSLVNLPVTAEGFLDVLKENPRVYNFDFRSHTGKRTELAAYDSTCPPRPYFVSRSEFIAFGCHGTTDKIEMSGFNLRGEEPWVYVFAGQHVSPAIISAPAASRFALSRVLIAGSVSFDIDSLLPSELTSQEIVVMQNHDGRTLLKLQLLPPVQRSGQNFDLSADGLALALIRNGVIELYALPPLNAGDHKDLQLASASEPEKNEATIHLISERTVAREPPAEALTVPTAPAETVAGEAAAPAAAATVGDVHPTDGPRKPPTLYDPAHPKTPNR